MTIRACGHRPHRRASLAVTTPVAVLVAVLATSSTSGGPTSATGPEHRPTATPPPVDGYREAAATVERATPDTTIGRGRPARSEASSDAPVRATEDAGPELVWPAEGELTSEFGPRWGRMHKGIDIAADTGTPIRAADDGRVVFSGWKGGYGQTIEIDHGHGLMTRYAHQSETAASEGAQVDRGQVIGRVGMTGSATGPHLHFEMRVHKKARDPRTALPALG